MIGQHRVAVSFAALLTSLGHHVRHVRGVVAQEEMSRVDAAPHVAAVKHRKVGWQRSIGLAVDEPMDQPRSTPVLDFCVAVVIETACPKPASAIRIEFDGSEQVIQKGMLGARRSKPGPPFALPICAARFLLGAPILLGHDNDASTCRSGIDHQVSNLSACLIRHRSFT